MVPPFAFSVFAEYHIVYEMCLSFKFNPRSGNHGDELNELSSLSELQSINIGEGKGGVNDGISICTFGVQGAPKLFESSLSLNNG